MTRRYAVDTKVPILQTRNEIEQLVTKYGADSFAYFNEPGKAIIVFQADGRRIRFDLPLPTDTRSERESRSRWRALLLTIKARLESVATGIETFDEAFLAHIVMPNGETVGAYSIPRIAAAYKGEALQPLLPAPSKGKTP